MASFDSQPIACDARHEREATRSSRRLGRACELGSSDCPENRCESSPNYRSGRCGCKTRRGSSSRSQWPRFRLIRLQRRNTRLVVVIPLAIPGALAPPREFPFNCEPRVISRNGFLRVSRREINSREAAKQAKAKSRRRCHSPPTSLIFASSRLLRVIPVAQLLKRKCKCAASREPRIDR